MGIEFLPYIFLLLSIIFCFIGYKKISLASVLVAIIIALVLERLNLIALVSILILGFTLWLPSQKNISNIARSLCYGAFLILAVAMMNHLVPGFKNLLVYDHVQFSPDSIPFTMYLNFDKVIVGIFICLFYLRTYQLAFDRKHFFQSIRHAALVIILLIGIAIPIHYMRFDFKFPQMGWLWILNNLFFVCLAEEAFFRGFIQEGLSRLFPKTQGWNLLAIFTAATLFGIAHYKGGLTYIMLALLAGLFYGHSYWKTKRIESAIIVHFCLNLVHFLFFSYPALLNQN